MKFNQGIWIILPIAIMLGLFLHKPTATYLYGEARWDCTPLKPGNISIPHQRTIQWQTHSETAEAFIRDYPFHDVNQIWNKENKSGNAKTMLWYLMAGENISEVNQILQQLQPWGTSGSAWLLNPEGGYNFALTPLTTILFLFDNRPDILFPKTKKHIAEILLTEEGGGFTDAVPNLLGRVKDSENHVLMAQSSKYLKNRYMEKHGYQDPKYNNQENGMEEGMLEHLSELRELGLYEFNSMPYSAYTITPLLNLEAFGSPQVRIAAREMLDYLSFTYALGSYNLRHFAPFRRRLDRHKVKTLTNDYQTAFMKSWMSFHPDTNSEFKISNGKKHALMGIALPYRPADKVVDLLFNKSEGYYVRLGHGTKSCPEIYSAGESYLLSAGGANQGKWSIIVARPTCLFLNDDAKELKDVIHLTGNSSSFMDWNNTGVYKNFACTNGPIHIPEKFTPAYCNDTWRIYTISEYHYAAVHTTKDLSILAIFESKKPHHLCKILQQNNPEKDKLHRQFQFPDGDLIKYDVNAPKKHWVIQSVNDQSFDRDFENWPLIQGEFYEPKTKS